MILVTDFDNTLYSHSDPHVLINNLQASEIFRQNGNKFVLATGRNISSLNRVLPNFYKYFDYIILNNGAICLHQNRETIFQYTIPANITQNISHDILQQFNDNATFVYYDGTKEWPVLDHGITKLRCWITNPQIGNEVLRLISQKYSNRVKSFLAKEAVMSSVNWINNAERYRSFVDIMSKDAGKENAIRRLVSKFPDEDVVTIGDDTNDIGMLTTFNGYAMQGSVPEVLKITPPGRIVSSVAELMQGI